MGVPYYWRPKNLAQFIEWQWDRVRTAKRQGRKVSIDLLAMLVTDSPTPDDLKEYVRSVITGSFKARTRPRIPDNELWRRAEFAAQVEVMVRREGISREKAIEAVRPRDISADTLRHWTYPRRDDPDRAKLLAIRDFLVSEIEQD
jgi:hypothetical protein